MTKYTSNEQYEKDRLKIIARHSILKDMGIDIIDLLKQSKWIGLQNAPQKIPYKKPEFLKDARSSNNETDS